MKIAIDARFYGLENGGLGRYTINLINELQKEDKQNQYSLLLRKEWFDKLNLESNFKKVLVKSRHYSFYEQIEVLKLLGNIKPDLTHFLHFNVPLLFNGKYIVTIHDLLMHTGIGREATTLSPLKYKVKRLGYRKIFDHAVNKASKIIVPSQFVKKEMLQTYSISENKIDVIYEGVAEFDNSKTILKKPKFQYFFYVGNAYPHKNLKILLKSIKDLEGLAKLILVTPRDVFTDRLNKEIKSREIDKYVLVKNKVSDDELFGLYKDSVAFVYPSFSEGFGLQGLEAMRIGTLLIASNIPVFHEIYKDKAIYFDPQDAGDLLKKMKTALQIKKEERSNILKINKEFVKNYSWNQMAKSVLKHYNAFK